MPFVIKLELLFMSILITYATYAIEYHFYHSVLMANLVLKLSSIPMMEAKFKRMEWQWRPIVNHISSIQWKGLASVGNTWSKPLVNKMATPPIILIVTLWRFFKFYNSKSLRPFSKHFFYQHVVKFEKKNWLLACYKIIVRKSFKKKF
jgi:hypothetical protein